MRVKVVNAHNYWHFCLTQKAVDLMGMENMYCEMMANPEGFLDLMRFLTDDCKRFLRWQEENRAIFANNGNDYMGSGSYCFNRELIPEGDKVLSIDTWGHLNSQESVGISKEMFCELVLPFNIELAGEFGLIYYGCCEPVSAFYDGGIEKIPNLRKLSISHWCDEEMMAERLSGSGIIYSRKPSPNFLGVRAEFDEEAFKAYIAKTARFTKNCKVEYIFRDIYKLHGNTGKLKRAVDIVRSFYR